MSKGVYVIFQLDTEDYITPQADDVLLGLVRIFNKHGIKGSFAIVGEKARVLERRGRRDVIEALRTQDIAYQSNHHSLHPTIAEYLKDLGWEEGVKEVIKRESKGIEDLKRIFGQLPSAFIQPGGSWAPQVPYVMRTLGIRVYADGIFLPQPMWFCGILAVRYSLSFHEKESGTPEHLQMLKQKFDEIYNALKESGGIVIIVLHPCMLLTKEFWDAINFARGAMPDELKPAPLVQRSLYERRLVEFEEFVSYIVKHPKVKVITFRELPDLYEEERIKLDLKDMEVLAEKIAEVPSFYMVNGKSVSLAEAFYALTYALKTYNERDTLPKEIAPPPLLGPLRMPPSLKKRLKVKSEIVLALAKSVYHELMERKVIPSEIRIGDDAIGPLSFLYVMAQAFLMILRGEKHEELEIVSLNEELSFKDYDVRKRVAGQWSWIIFPEGFRSEKIMELTLLQLWTLKPAVMKDLND